MTAAGQSRAFTWMHAAVDWTALHRATADTGVVSRETIDGD